MLKVLWLIGEFKEVVELGTRILTLYSVIAPELCKDIGDHVIPLMTHGQEEVIDLTIVSSGSRSDYS